MKTVDLLSFQRDLNEQFMDIFHDKQLGIVDNDHLDDQLGLTLNFQNNYFFVPIKQLKKISMKNDFAQIVKTKSWLFGFNQEFGQIYTIFNLEKLLNYMINAREDFEHVQIQEQTRILYLQSYENQNNAILVNNLELNYSQQYEKILTLQNNQWHILDRNAEKQLDVLKELAIKNKILFYILKYFQEKQSLFQDSFSYMKANIKDVNFLSLCIKDVYVKQNKDKKDVIFSLDLKKMMEYMLDENAYD